MKETSAAPKTWPIEFPPEGPAGDPVDLSRTFRAHGLTSLPPMRTVENTLEITLSTEARQRTALISTGRTGYGSVDVVGPQPGCEEGERLLAAVRYVLRLDENLSLFYEMAARAPELSWATRGAGRMIRGATVFEDVIKTFCTTNCAWSATIRMTNALVEHWVRRPPEPPRPDRGDAPSPPPKRCPGPERTSTKTSCALGTGAGTCWTWPARLWRAQ